MTIELICIVALVFVCIILVIVIFNQDNKIQKLKKECGDLDHDLRRMTMIKEAQDSLIKIKDLLIKAMKATYGESN